MPKRRVKKAAWAVTFALAAYMLWPAWAGAASYDVGALAPLYRLARALGVQVPADVSDPYAAAAFIGELITAAQARARELGLTFGGPGPEAPPPEAPAAGAAAPTAGGPPPVQEAPPLPPFRVRDAWLDAGTYGLADGELKSFPVHFQNWLLFTDVSAIPWLGDWRDLAQAGRGYYTSGEVETWLDRGLQEECYDAWRQQEEFYAWEQEQGLIPDVELGKESDIKFEGRKLFNAGYARTDYPGGGTPGYEQPGNDITMEGELQLRIEGTVMRKTHVYVDYDDTRENDTRNQVSVVYKGDPDELVQEAAFGDIVLSLPATEFVSYSSSRAVFGAKVDLKYKWAELMAIASREKGKTEKATFTGGTELTSANLADTAYTKRKFFLLNTAHYPNGDLFFSDNRNKIYLDPTANNQPAVALFLYHSQWTPGITEYHLDAYEFDDKKGMESGGEEKTGTAILTDAKCKRLTLGTDFNVDADTGIITLNTTVEEDDALAVAYVVANQSNTPIYNIGYKDDNKNLDYDKNGNVYDFGDVPLKCVKAIGNGGAVQRYEQKNYYNLGSTSIQPTSLIIKVFDTAQNEIDPEGDGKSYLYTLGLDRNNDGQVDGAFIDTTNGFLIIADVKLDNAGNFVPKDDNDDTYYDNLPFDYDANGVVEDAEPKHDAYPPGILEHKRTIYVEYQSLKPSYFLHANIIPGSEVVTLNGTRLVPNRDYWLDYDSGFLELLIEGADDPTAVLEVTYEYKPLFALLTKSILGGRFQFGPDDDRYLGTTLVAEFTSKPPPGEVPTLDEAPTYHHVFDVDGRYRVYPEVMTKLADAVPGAHTEEDSTLDLQAEFARSFKNVNTAGVANVDDMESARQLSALPTKEQAWRPSSVPAEKDINQANRGDSLLRPHTLSEYLLQQVDKNWPAEMLELLQITNLPDNPDGSGGNAFRWGGVNYVLSTTGQDFTESRFDSIEIMLNLNNLTNAEAGDDVRGGLLHFDLGTVDEDTDGDNNLDTEDKPTGPGGTRNGRLDTDEDTGYEFDNRDAGGRIRNAHYGADNNVLDTEDNNRDDSLNHNNNYYALTVDLGEVVNGQSPYVVRGPSGNNPLQPGWYILRVPLNFDDANTVGNADATKIQSFRMWVEAETDDDFPRPAGPEGEILSSLWFGGVTFTAMKWETPVLNPAKGLNEMKISTKDSRHDADYVPLNPHEDVETGTQEREQALVLDYILTDWEDIGVSENKPGNSGMSILTWGAGNNQYDTEDVNHNGLLDPGEDVGVGPDHVGAGNGRLDEEPAPEGSTRVTNASPADYTRYRYLQLWVYNKTPADNGGNGSDNDIVFIRFGADEDNYYEFAAQLGGAGWQSFAVSMERFLALQTKGQPFIDENKPVVEGHYFIVGDPSFLNVVETSVGVRTKTPRAGGSGGFLDYREVWINDIELRDPENKVGTARRGRLSLDFGNFIRWNTGARKVDANFEEIGTTGTALSTTTSKDMDATVELAKFMPDQWNVRMPVSGSVTKSETITEEKYDPQQSIYNQGRTLAVTRELGLSFDKYKLPSWDLGYRTSDSVNYKYNRATNADTYSAGFDYDVYPRKGYLPSNLRTDFDRRFQDEVYGKGDENKNRFRLTDDSRNSVTYEPVEDFEVKPSYDYGSTRDRKDGSEESYDETYGLKVNYNRVKGLRPGTSYTSTYRETVQINTPTGGGSGGGGGGGGGESGGTPPEYYAGGYLKPGDTMDLSVSTDYNFSIPVEIGKLTSEKAVGVNKWSVTPSYDLIRSSNYEDMTARPPMWYRVGRHYTLERWGAPETAFVSSRIRHSVTVSNRLNPLEYLGARTGTKWENWDFIQADVDYSYSNELSYQQSSYNRTITTTFPDVTLQLYGTKNFPLVAAYLDRSTVVLSYSRKHTYEEAQNDDVKHQPSISWRATWTPTFRSRADYNFAVTKNLELTEPSGVVRKEWEKNPSLTLYYDLAMPKGFKIPLLGTLRWRNELNLSAGVSYTQVRVSDFSTDDNTNEYDYTLSGGYYITTNLHADITGSVKQFTNLSQVGQNYTTTGVNGNFEIIF